jgi:hypothetical protein
MTRLLPESETFGANKGVLGISTDKYLTIEELPPGPS